MGGSQSTEETESEYVKPWRDTPWGEKDHLEKTLKDFGLCDQNIKYARILVVGEIGAGKSSFINSVNSVFQRRITNEALLNKTTDTSKTFTKCYKTYYIRNGQSPMPFVLTDTMGLESDNLHGIHPEDIVKAMEGCIMERYKFNPESPITSQDNGYRRNPGLQDQTYCLVFVIAADKISVAADDIYKKVKYIKSKADELEIPQVMILTRSDEACPLVKKNIRKVYTSKKIKEKLEECSANTGISVSHVFPVKCYHEEIDTQDDMDVLILRAFKHIVQMANDALRLKCNEKENSE
ncbi:interferon-induced protein 44-like [Sinocyclocheilus grahami]|uniref:Interferon-induced protein 44-like n=1 Tax=Sinocyclocheilus grahami TaxID=75366 RepID=A0A672MAN5_SINGR|nr:PREDICTED: interferon-induced protein 44-like [Sinocyclocheilus grahami]